MFRSRTERQLETEWREAIDERQLALTALGTSSAPDSGNAGFHLFYSTRREDVPLLRESLASVLRAVPGGIDSVTVLQDCASPLIESERDEMSAMAPVSIRYPVSAYPLKKGPRRILSLLDEYIEIAASVPPSAWIVKLDTDILFLGDRHLLEAQASSSDHFGHAEECRAPFLYAQGGCYFVRAGMVVRWERQVLMETMREAAWRTKKGSIARTPEDAFFSLCTERAGGRVELASFYFEPSEDDWTHLDAAAPETLTDVFDRYVRGTVYHAQGRDKAQMHRLASILSAESRRRATVQ